VDFIFHRTHKMPFEEFRVKVIGHQETLITAVGRGDQGEKLYVETNYTVGGVKCPCGHPVGEHGVPSDAGCSICKCPLTWVEAGLKALGLSHADLEKWS